jgi:GNAT superfamily N-acetyltransferase
MTRTALEVRRVAYDHPDAVELIAQVQRVYVERYGDEDATPVEPGEFAPPHGGFLVGYRDSEPVVCGGWRAHEAADGPGFADGDAEVKRMYVVPSARGAGHARALLAVLESAARAAGRRRMVLETGTLQPEAIALYTSSGYERIDNFGTYRCEPSCRCYGRKLS